jgi:hypothetical protein
MDVTSLPGSGLMANIERADLALPRRCVGNRRGGRRDGVESVTPDDTPEDTPMTIGEVAREFGITLRARRFFESKRLITPA